MRKPSLMINRVSASERFQTLNFQVPPDVISMDKGEPDFSTPLHIQDAAYKAMRDNNNHYVNPQGDIELREAICDRYATDYKVTISPKNVLVTAGGIEAIAVVCGSYIDPGDEVIIMNPEYSAIPEAVNLFGGIPVRVNRKNNLDIDLEEVKDSISARTKAIMVTNPGNPTGKIIIENDLLYLADLALEHDLFLVVDEVYDKLIFEESKFKSICQLDHLKERAILLNSFSKTYAMTGWRVGYTVASESVIRTLLYLHLSLLICVSAPLQKACVAALRGPQDCVFEMKSEYGKRRKYVSSKISEVNRLHPAECQGAFYFFPKFDHRYTSNEMVNYLVSNGVKVRSGSEFGDAGQKHIRLTFTSSLEDLELGMERLTEAFNRLD